MPEPTAVSIGPIADLPVGEFVVKAIGRREIGVVRLADGRVHAVLNRCPHRGAPVCAGVLSGTLLPGGPDELRLGMAGEVLRCPWHGYEFGLADGACLFTGSRLRLRTFRVEVRDGEVFVHGA